MRPPVYTSRMHLEGIREKDRQPNLQLDGQVKDFIKTSERDPSTAAFSENKQPSLIRTPERHDEIVEISKVALIHLISLAWSILHALVVFIVWLGPKLFAILKWLWGASRRTFH